MILLPGSLWRPALPPPFPWAALPVALGALAGLGLLGVGTALALGPAAGTSRLMTALEAPPDLLWGGLVLAFWPRDWGPPGPGAWVLAFLAAALPSDIRWLSQALPAESPFPRAWGRTVARRARAGALVSLAPAWVAARMPVWITGGLVLERILAFRGLGSDWLDRVLVRDRLGLSAWILALALLWRLASPVRKVRP